MRGRRVAHLHTAVEGKVGKGVRQRFPLAGGAFWNDHVDNEDTTLRFTQQPSNQTVTSGNTATFSVTVTGGTPPYSYQWQLDSGSGFANIGGATSASYETPALTTGDTGNEYRCVVTDDVAAEITSNAAVVTVAFIPDEVFTGDDDDWWDASTDTDMTFVAARSVDQYSVTSEIVTIRTTVAHGMITGDSVVVAGVAAAVNGTWTVATVPTSTTLTYIAVGAGDIGDTAASGTVNWEHRKMSAWAGRMGNWTLTQATLANMPQYNATTNKVIMTSARSYYMGYSSGLTAAIVSADVGLWVATSRTASVAQNYVVSKFNGSVGNQFRFGGGFSDATQQTYTVGGSSPSSLSYTAAANNNGNLKVWVVNGTSTGRQIYGNDMTTAAASDANSGQATGAGGVMYMGRFSDSGTPPHYSGTVGSHGFKVGGTLTEQNRIDLKAWGEAQGDTYG